MIQKQKDLLQKHIQQFALNPSVTNFQISTQDQNNNQNHITTFIYTPVQSQTIYDEFPFKFIMKIPSNYPQQPPLLFFDKSNLIYHLNVHPLTGQIFLSALKDDWSPFLSLTTIGQILQNIFSEPDIITPASKDILNQYKHRFQAYCSKAQKNFQLIKNKTGQNSPKSMNQYQSSYKNRKSYGQYEFQQSQKNEAFSQKNYFSNLSPEQQQKVIKDQIQRISNKKKIYPQVISNQQIEYLTYQTNKFDPHFGNNNSLSSFIKKQQRANGNINMSEQNKNQIQITLTKKKYQLSKNIPEQIKEQFEDIQQNTLIKNSQSREKQKQRQRNEKEASIGLSTPNNKISNLDYTRNKTEDIHSQSNLNLNLNKNYSFLSTNQEQQKINNETLVLQQKLKRAVSTLNIFTDECLSIEQKLKLASHPKLRKMLQNQLQQQIIDIEEISQIVSNLKKNLIRKTKLDGILK